MVMLINPMLMPSAGPPQRLVLLWYATYNRLIYRDSLALTQQVMDIAGGVFAHEEPGSVPWLPRVEVWTIPPGNALVGIRGTTDVSEAVQEVLRSFLYTDTAWTGQVNAFFGLLANTIRNKIELFLTPTWAITGHSLGAGVAPLVARFGASISPIVLADFCAPRSGNGEYAAAQRFPQRRYRITNEGDPVPFLPPSTASEYDQLPALLPIPGTPTYRHWGFHLHLFPDGSATMPADASTFTEFGAEIIRIFNLQTTWLAAHSTAEVCRRLRAGIPVRFPSPGDPDFPGLAELDALAQALNQLDGIVWRIGARDDQRPRPAPEGGGGFVPPVFAPQICGS